MGTHPIFESDFDCLTDVQNMAEVIFSRQLRVIITSASTSRHHHIELIIERAKEVRSNCYHLRLTDPTDFFFLYTATIDEREFHQLKQYQTATLSKETKLNRQIEGLERELAEYRVKCDELNNDSGELRNRGQLQLDELKNQFEHKLNIEREKNMNEIKDKNSSHDTALKQYEN